MQGSRGIFFQESRNQSSFKTQQSQVFNRLVRDVNRRANSKQQIQNLGLQSNNSKQTPKSSNKLTFQRLFLDAKERQKRKFLTQETKSLRSSVSPKASASVQKELIKRLLDFENSRLAKIKQKQQEKTLKELEQIQLVRKKYQRKPNSSDFFERLSSPKKLQTQQKQEQVYLSKRDTQYLITRLSSPKKEPLIPQTRGRKLSKEQQRNLNQRMHKVPWRSTSPPKPEPKLLDISKLKSLNPCEKPQTRAGSLHQLARMTLLE